MRVPRDFRAQIGSSGFASTATIALCALALLLHASSSSAQVAPPQLISIDIDAVSIDGSFTLDGGAFPADYADTGILSLAGADGDEVILGFGADQTYGPLLAVSGSYDPSYRILLSNGGVPINPLTTVDASVDLTADGPLDVAVESITITPSFELNGDPFPSAIGQHAEFFLRDVDTGLELPLGVSFTPSSPIRLIPGTYDVIYRYVSGNQIPENLNAVIMAGVLVDTPGKFTIDVPCMLHRLDFYLDGSPPPVSMAERGAIALHDFATGDSVSFGSTDDLVAIRHIVPGTYDVTFSHIAGGSIVPRNALAIVEPAVSIQPLDVSTPVDVVTALLTPDPTLDGAPFPASTAEDGHIILVGEHDDRVDLGITSVQPMSPLRVVVGTYDVYYEHDSGGGIAPANRFGRVAEQVAISSDGTLPIDVTTVLFAPNFTLDAAPFPASTAERGDLVLQGNHPDDTIELGSTHQPINAKRVIVGTYDIVYDWAAGGSIVPVNRSQVVARPLINGGFMTAIDVVTQVVQHDVTLDGLPFPADPAHRGELALVGIGIGIGSDSEVPLGTTSDVAANVRSLVGIYEVRYRWTAGDQVPLNSDATIGLVNVPEPSVGAGLLAGAALLFALRRRAR